MMFVSSVQMASKMNYWEMQKTFWKTPKGIIIWFILLTTILGGGLLALNIYVSPYPVIEFFDAKPIVVSSGNSSNLSWSVIGADSVAINQGFGEVELKGSKLVSPSETTTYTLTAINGTINRSFNVKVLVKQL
jgi:hypothetical protein